MVLFDTLFAGETKIIRDNYNVATIEMWKDDDPIYTVNVEMRACNKGAALRFFLRMKKEFIPESHWKTQNCLYPKNAKNIEQQPVAMIEL